MKISEMLEREKDRIDDLFGVNSIVYIPYPDSEVYETRNIVSISFNYNGVTVTAQTGLDRIKQEKDSYAYCMGDEAEAVKLLKGEEE